MHEARAVIHKIDGNAVTLDEVESSKKRKFTVEAFASDLVEGGPGLNVILTQMNATLGQMNATLGQMNATLDVLTANSTRMRNNEKRKYNEAQLVGWLALQVEDAGNHPVGSIPGVQPVTNAAVMGLNNNQIDALETAFNKPAGHFGGLGATLPARRSAVHAFYTKVVY